MNRVTELTCTITVCLDLLLNTMIDKIGVERKLRSKQLSGVTNTSGLANQVNNPTILIKKFMTLYSLRHRLGHHGPKARDGWGRRIQIS